MSVRGYFLPTPIPSAQKQLASSMRTGRSSNRQTCDIIGTLPLSCKRSQVVPARVNQGRGCSGTMPFSHTHEAVKSVVCKRNHPESLRWQDPASLLFVRIGDTALQEAARSLLSRDHIELRPELRVTDDRITNLLYALEAERACGYQAGNLFIDSIEAALAAMLVTSPDRIQSKPAVRQGGLPPRRMRRVLEFIHANIGKQLTLENIAACAELSSSHFLHQFRKSMNTSSYKYVVAVRIEESKRMLRNRHLSVLEVAQAVGFDNPQHFATVFRRIAGVSPSTYRSQL